MTNNRDLIDDDDVNDDMIANLNLNLNMISKMKKIVVGVVVYFQLWICLFYERLEIVVIVFVFVLI